MKTVRVPEVNVDRLVERLTKLAKRAVKLEVAPPTWTVSEPFVADSGEKNEKTGEPVLRRYCTVEVTGEAPRFAGWRLAAVLTSLGDGNIIRAVPGEEIPATFRTAPIVCDHCHLVRNRAETFVVAHDDGTFKQVGRSCLRDFLGHKNPESLASAAELLFSIDALCEEAAGWGSEGAWTAVAELGKFLAMVACLIRRNGWMSRGEARDRSKSATADDAFHCLFPNTYLRRAWQCNPELEPKPTDADAAEAAKAVDWAAALGEDVNDFLWNVRAVARFGFVGYKEAGVAAAIMNAYRRAVGDDLKRRIAADSKHFGTEGVREVFELTLTGVHSIEGQFGVTNIHRFLTPDGNTAVWFASGGKTLGTVGEKVKVKATVKRHETRNGAAETVLTRVKEEA